jgi:hypothetical protein
MLGGNVHPDVAFYLKTESPNIGLPAGGGEGFDNFYLQDAFTTWKWNRDHVVDAGLLLVPGSYNHLQDEARYLTLDHGPYSYTESGPLISRVGRDPGVQARGLLAGKMLEYRLGVFQGIRGTEEGNPFRVAARVAVHPYGNAGTGYFYPGTNMGTANAFSIGVAADIQKTYASLHGDIFVEQPIAAGTTATFQADFSRYDGGSWLGALPKQDSWLLEFGIATLENRLGTYLQAAGRSYDKGFTDDRQVGAGLCWRIAAHRANLKLDWTRVEVSRAQKCIQRYRDRDVITLQCQAYYF